MPVTRLLIFPRAELNVTVYVLLGSSRETDTIPLSETAQACSKIRQLSIAELLAETMRRVSNEESVSSLFVD